MEIGYLRTLFTDLSNMIEIGKGGQKTVIGCTHPQHGEIVLKIYFAGSNNERIAREISASNDINHPAIPRIISQGTKNTPSGDLIWIYEERIFGKSLRQHLEEKGQINEELIPELCKQLIDIIVAAENSSIVHRDIKPENIMIDINNKFWLLDFGIARHLDKPTLTAAGFMNGSWTPGYAPPEQIQNLTREIDSRADLFALGVTIFESIEGLNPFTNNSPDIPTILRKSISDPLPSIQRTFNKSAEVNSLIQAITQKRPNHRPRTCAEAKQWIDDIFR